MKPFAELLKIPGEHPDVRARTHAVLEHNDLLVEDISWPTLDQQEAPALVVRPRQKTGPLPAIVCLHGTGGNRELLCLEEFGIGAWTPRSGRSSQITLRGWASALARQGYVTLALTQRGLDVRTPDTNDQAKDLLVHGRTLMGAIVYEIRQAITYLQQRDDVAANAIGVTGLSFGGITTFYTWLVDERITAAAAICGGVGSVETLLRCGVPGYHGLYWWIPDMLTAGDQADFAALRAPHPLMLWAPLQDIGMPAEGVERFEMTVRPAYHDAGAEEALVIHRPPGEHAFTLEAFDALTRFFAVHLRPL